MGIKFETNQSVQYQTLICSNGNRLAFHRMLSGIKLKIQRNSYKVFSEISQFIRGPSEIISPKFQNCLQYMPEFPKSRYRYFELFKVMLY